MERYLILQRILQKELNTLRSGLIKNIVDDFIIYFIFGYSTLFVIQ